MPSKRAASRSIQAKSTINIPNACSGIIWNFQPATVIGLPCPVTTTMRTGSAGKQGYAGKSRQRLAAQMRGQAGCDFAEDLLRLAEDFEKLRGQKRLLSQRLRRQRALERRPAKLDA